MKISIIGGGNIGTLIAAEMAYKGHDVVIFSSKPSVWAASLEVYTPADQLVLSTQSFRVTNNLGQAVQHADLIWIAYPASFFSELAQRMAPFARPGQLIGVVPGSGGAEFAFRPLLQQGCILFGLQRVHSIARLKEYGKSVYMLGRKPELYLGCIPNAHTVRIAELVSKLFDMPCFALPNYLSVTLTPSNPILHITRLFSMFRDYAPGKTYSKNILFYEEWTEHSSEMLLACDAELQELCSTIPLDLHDVKSLKEHYESDTPQKMTCKISGIAVFKGLTSPMVETADGWVPDFTSRYFTSDFSYGLKIIKDICHLFSIPCPNIDAVWDWYAQMDAQSAQNSFQLNLDRSEFMSLYQ